MATIVTPAHGCMHDDIEIIPMTGAVHCTNCGMWWYDANAYVFTHPGRSEATPNASQPTQQHETILNPDNEPTSEANQWKEQDNG